MASSRTHPPRGNPTSDKFGTLNVSELVQSFPSSVYTPALSMAGLFMAPNVPEDDPTLFNPFSDIFTAIDINDSTKNLPSLIALAIEKLSTTAKRGSTQQLIIASLFIRMEYLKSIREKNIIDEDRYKVLMGETENALFEYVSNAQMSREFFMDTLINNVLAEKLKQGDPWAAYIFDVFQRQHPELNIFDVKVFNFQGESAASLASTGGSYSFLYRQTKPEDLYSFSATAERTAEKHVRIMESDAPDKKATLFEQIIDPNADTKIDLENRISCSNLLGSLIAQYLMADYTEIGQQKKTAFLFLIFKNLSDLNTHIEELRRTGNIEEIRKINYHLNTPIFIGEPIKWTTIADFLEQLNSAMPAELTTQKTTIGRSLELLHSDGLDLYNAEQMLTIARGTGDMAITTLASVGVRDSNIHDYGTLPLIAPDTLSSMADSINIDTLFCKNPEVVRFVHSSDENFEARLDAAAASLYEANRPLVDGIFGADYNPSVIFNSEQFRSLTRSMTLIHNEIALIREEAIIVQKKDPEKARQLWQTARRPKENGCR